jgi:glycine cleavage system H protein
VLEVNQEATDSPELVNKDPHGKAWLVVIRLSDAGEVGNLMSASDYQKYVEEEAGA